MSDAVHFEGRPSILLTIDGFAKMLAGRNIDLHFEFGRHITLMMRAHSGHARNFIHDKMHIGQNYWSTLLRKRRLYMHQVEIIKEHLNIDAAPFLDGRYPPLRKTNS